MITNKKTLSYLSMAIAMIIVGSGVVAGKLITVSLPIFLSSFLSLFIAFLLFLPTIVSTVKSKVIDKNDYFYLALQALLGTVLYRILLFISLKYIDASFAGIISALQPAAISLLAVLFLKERQTYREKIGVFLAVSGLFIAYLANKISISLTSGLLLGTILSLLAVLGEACFSVFAKKLNKNISPISTAGMVTALSCAMSFPIAFIDFTHFNIASFSILGIGLIAYYGIFLTYVSFIFWFSGLKHSTASVAGIFTALAPLSGVILSILILKETPNIFELIGGVLIILSIILVVNKNEK